MSDTTGVTNSRRLRLGPRTRRMIRLAHIIGALGWLGVDVVIGVLAITAAVSDDPKRIVASYTALDIFAVPLLLTFGLTTLGLGLLLAWSSGWGIARHWWIVIKLGINLVLGTLAVAVLQPRIRHAAEQAALVDAGQLDQLPNIGADLVSPPFISGTALLLAAILATSKPWGTTPWGRATTRQSKERLRDIASTPTRR